MRYDTGGPFIVWLDFGFDGWSPRSFDTLEEATKLALSDKHDESFVITRVVSEERFICICTKAKGMNYRINTRVKRIERRTRVVRRFKVGDEVHTDTEDMGWYVQFENSWESLYLGHEEPMLVNGQAVTIVIEAQ